MKTKFNLLLVMLLSSLCITFTSCSDDDDDDDIDYAKEIVGTYKGDIFLGDSETPVSPDASIIITRTATNKVTLKIDETIPEIGLPVKVECESDVTLTDSKYEVKGKTSFEMENIPLPVDVKGNIDKEGNAIINITLEIPGTPINVVYNGKRQ